MVCEDSDDICDDVDERVNMNQLQQNELLMANDFQNFAMMGTGAHGNAIREALNQIEQDAYQTGNPLVPGTEAVARDAFFNSVREDRPQRQISLAEVSIEAASFQINQQVPDFEANY